MFSRLWLCLALVGLIAVPSAARSAPAAEKKAKSPALVVRVQSVDVLLNNFRYLADLVGFGEQAKQIEGIVGGPKLLEGIDAKRPLALYASFGDAGIFDSTAVALIPITEEKAFLDLIDKLGAKTTKDKDGLYTISDDKLPVPVYFRFANKYAYVTAQNENAIAKDKLLLPSAVLPEGKLPLASVTLRIDQIPENLRDIAVGQVEDKFKAAKDENKDNETPAQHAAKVAILDRFEKNIISAIKDGRDLSARLDVDQKTKELTAELGLTAKGDSTVGKFITELGQAKSVVAGLVGRNSIGHFAIDIPNDAKMAEAIQNALKDSFKQIIAQEADAGKKAVLVKLYEDSIEPALRVTDLDGSIDLRGPHKGGRYTIVGGVKVANGPKTEKAIRDVITTVQPKTDEVVKFDAEKAGDVSIHRIAAKAIPAEAKQKLGDGDAYFAVRSDALMFAVGEDGLAALKEALEAPPKAGKAINVELSVARLAQAMSDQRPEAPKAAAKAFGDDKDNDTVRLSLEGGRELKLRFVVKTPVLTFFHQMQSAAEGK